MGRMGRMGRMGGMGGMGFPATLADCAGMFRSCSFCLFLFLQDGVEGCPELVVVEIYGDGLTILYIQATKATQHESLKAKWGTGFYNGLGLGLWLGYSFAEVAGALKARMQFFQMKILSTRDEEFLKGVHPLFAGSEVLVVVRYAYGAGSKDFHILHDMSDLEKLLDTPAYASKVTQRIDVPTQSL